MICTLFDLFYDINQEDLMSKTANLILDLFQKIYGLVAMCDEHKPPLNKNSHLFLPTEVVTLKLHEFCAFMAEQKEHLALCFRS